MKCILLIGINFFPDPTSTGKYSGELAAYLSQHGHEVRVITAPPYYPHWRVAAGYHAGRYRRENWHGVAIWRCPLWVPRQPNGLRRLLHLASFALSSLPALAAQLRWRPQVVLCVAPTLMNAPGALLLARLCGAKSWLHLQDFELDAALGLGLLPGRRCLAHLAAWVEYFLYRQFDHISTISGRMLARLAEKGIPAEKCFLLPNWVETGQIHPLEGENPLRAALGLRAETLVALYAGNLGRKQGLEIVIEAARLLQGQAELHFVICGDGVARAELERLGAGLGNLTFLPVQPAEKLNQLLNLADMHLLPQRADVADLVMPSKLGGMLASGKAVIASAQADTGVGEVMRAAGLLAPPEDAPALAAAIHKLAGSPSLRAHLGKKGLAYARAHWSAERVLAEYLQKVDKMG